MHQRANAKVLEQAGAAIVLDDSRDAAKNSEILHPLLDTLMYDQTRRQTMAEAARQLGRPEAAAEVAAAINEFAVANAGYREQ